MLDDKYQVPDIQSPFLSAITLGEDLSLKLCENLLLKIKSFVICFSDQSENDNSGLKAHSMKMPHVKKIGANIKQKSSSYQLPLKVASVYASRILPNFDVKQCYDEMEIVNNHFKTKFITDSLSGFDWFMATVLIIMQMNSTKTLDFLTNFSVTTSALYFWPCLGRSIENNITNDSSISNITATLCHWVGAIVEVHLPKIASAFTLNGCSISQVSDI